ncbi:unnamed protein product [Caenorhabditis angaria]|uniref:Laminin G domain-containing protein n=1 Tax=Caenorhabditis angaria TaxID=860376 RepID=A0A9P1IAZ2_9PELO|nr:unnamed protein product [Caenorhabditis angaria]
MHMKLNGEYQKYKFDQILDTDISAVFIGSDGKWESSQLSSTLNYLEIDENPIMRENLKIYHLPPRIERSLEFRNNGSLRFENLAVNPREYLKIEIIFKSYSSSGLIFYWTSPDEPSGDFVTMALIDRKPHFVYDLGSGLSYTKSEPIAINEWTTVKIERIGKNATMWINSKVVCRHVSAGQNQHLDLGKNNIFYVGFVDEENDVARKVKKLNTPFNGQIQMIRVNELPLDLVKVRK